MNDAPPPPAARYELIRDHAAATASLMRGRESVSAQELAVIHRFDDVALAAQFVATRIGLFETAQALLGTAILELEKAREAARSA